jgi:hypothetical protein
MFNELNISTALIDSCADTRTDYGSHVLELLRI